VYDQEKCNVFSHPDRVPALLSGFIDSILDEEESRIVEHFRGRFEADPVLCEVGICLRRIPLVLALERAQEVILPTSEQLRQTDMCLEGHSSAVHRAGAIGA